MSTMPETLVETDTATTDAQAMLTLAALAYRGFQDTLPGDPPAAIARAAIARGLDDLEPLRDEWELAWGPVTGRMPLGVFDSCAMYVVRSRRAARRYAIAVRGTNPIASSDWLFGDLWIGTTVQWPFEPGAAAISTSTALGLATLLDMQSRPPSTAARFAEAALASDDSRDALEGYLRAGRAAVTGNIAHAALPFALERQAAKVLDHWIDGRVERDGLRARLQRVASGVHVDPADLQRTWAPTYRRAGGIDLVTFLRAEAEDADEALDVAVAGHGKGGALATALALWLSEALSSHDPSTTWAAPDQARVACHTFAAPTPGNAAFAARVEARLGADQHHLRNAHDLATHAWQPADVVGIPRLYCARSAYLRPLVPAVLDAVRDLEYRHAASGETFRGELDPHRSLAAEIVHQHLDAYLAHLGLLGPRVNAATFFA